MFDRTSCRPLRPATLLAARLETTATAMPHRLAVGFTATFALVASVASAAPYDYFRTAAADYVVAQRLTTPAAQLAQQTAYDVTQCMEAPSTVRSQPIRTSAMAQLAIEAAVTRADLRSLGYPKAIVDVEVGRYETATLALIARKADADLHARSAALAKAIEAWRQANAPRLRPIIAEGGCGAAESPVRFELRPAGRLALIPRFYAAVCRARGVDPYDRQKCDGWGEVTLDRNVYLSGEYAFAATWADGRSRRGDLRIDPNDDKAGPPIVVTPER